MIILGKVDDISNGDFSKIQDSLLRKNLDKKCKRFGKQRFKSKTIEKVS